MPTDMKLWEVVDDNPITINRSKLDLEDRLEEWIEKDISIISDNLLVIGRQVSTDYGGVIDLLCLDPEANVVILELKRHKTPRDIVAQALDYASWVKDLSLSQITRISSDVLKSSNLEESFVTKFGISLPDVVNMRHRMYIVASEIDSATERIVRYLSEAHGVDINVATFAYFKKGELEFLGKSMLLDEDVVQVRAERDSKRKPNLTWEQLDELADEYNVRELYTEAYDKLRPFFSGASRTLSSVSLVGSMGDSKSRLNIANIVPAADQKKSGLLGFQVYEGRFSEFFRIPFSKAASVLDEVNEDVVWFNEAIYGLTAENLEALVQLLNTVKEEKQ